MKKIIYYVAISIDGFIAGKDHDISSFIYEGKAVDKYLNDLKQFKTVIMGKNTYEFGYQFGLVPGQVAYEGMTHFIFSKSLSFDEKSEHVHIKSIDTNEVEKIKKDSPTDIYLCGGGIFSGWLMENKLIDELRIKLNPITLGEGIPLFDKYYASYSWDLYKTESFDDGIIILSYKRT
jgi:dihydrofolate reductase